MGAKRLATAAVLLPLFVLYVMKLPPFYFVLLIALASALAQSEFYSMYRLKGPLKYTGLALGALIIAGIHLSGGIIGVLALSFIVITAVRLFIEKEPSSSLKDTATVVFGLVYIPVLLGYQINLRSGGPEWIILLYGTVWCSDAFAYYIGKAVGKRKLYESVSPKKTVAGGVGSVLGGVSGALVLRAVLVTSLPLPVAALSGAVIGIVTVIGDLVESMLKRDAGVKDSSTILPGHGGILDKIDGAVFAGPTLLWLLTAVGALG
jgi:phosphatidate cytidylyltransferase